jgi:uncharacterized protein YlaI
MSDLFGNAKGPADLGGEYIEVKDESEPIRILYCWNCKTIEELPNFEGHPDDDILLEYAIEKHESAGIKHTGSLLKVGKDTWGKENMRKEIIKNLREQTGGLGSGLANIDKEYYHTKSTFHDDAMKCFNLHNRPEGMCGDYAAERKKLIPKTHAERKELGLPVSTTSIYLCDFCPVKSFVVTKQREKTGQYK